MISTRFPGPAFNSGAIQKGDILCEINGQSVLRCSPSQVSAYLVGPEETSVTMAFLRGEEKLVTSLVRRNLAGAPRGASIFLC